MAIQRTPAQQPPKKKSGLGCLGCGCLVIVLFLLLLGGLIGGIAYFGYKQMYAFTSDAPAAIPAYAGSDDVAAGVQKKLDAFNQDVSTGKTSTLTLNSDELNAIFAHDPDLKRLNIHLLATLTGEQARLQGVVPADDIPFRIFPGRYINFDATFGLVFNKDSSRLSTNLRKLQLGDKDLPDQALPTMDAEFLPWIQMILEHYPAAKNAVASASSIAIKDGNLVVQTK